MPDDMCTMLIESSTVTPCGAAGLQVDLGAAQARQDQRLAAVHQVAAVELGASTCTVRSQWRSACQVSWRVGRGRRRSCRRARRTPCRGRRASPRSPRPRRTPCSRGGSKPNTSLQAVEQRRGRLLLDAHRAVALHVAVAAHRAQAGAGPADVAAQHQQVGDHLDRRHRVLVLRDAHAPAGDDAARRPGRRRRRARICASRQARLLLERVPGLGAQVGQQRVEADGVLGDEGVVEHAGRAGVLQLDDALHHALEQPPCRRRRAAGSSAMLMRVEPS